VTTGWIAWDTEAPDEGVVFVWAHDVEGAIATACRDMGYDLDEVVRLDVSPRELVTVKRCKALDGHTRYALPEDVREAAEAEAEPLVRAAAEKQAARLEAFNKMMATAKAAKSGGAA
jgi:hypothetical protein